MWLGQRVCKGVTERVLRGEAGEAGRAHIRARLAQRGPPPPTVSYLALLSV